MTERHLRGFNSREQCTGNDDAADEGAIPRQGSAIRKREVRILGCSLPLPAPAMILKPATATYHRLRRIS